MRDINFVIKTVAKEKNLSEEVVGLIYTAYWKRIIKMLKSYKHESIYVKNIGTFYLSYSLLYKDIKTYISLYRRSTKKREKNQYLKKIKNLLRLRSKVSSIYYDKFTKKSMGE